MSFISKERINKTVLVKLGRERIDETFDPSLSMQRSIDTYRAKGYDEK